MTGHMILGFVLLVFGMASWLFAGAAIGAVDLREKFSKDRPDFLIWALLVIGLLFLLVGGQAVYYAARHGVGAC